MSSSPQSTLRDLRNSEYRQAEDTYQGMRQGPRPIGPLLGMAIEAMTSVALEGMRDEAKGQCPEWRDVGEMAERELAERKAKTDAQ